MERNEVISTLRGRADEAQAVCAGLTDAEMRERPADGGWSLLEICCHLRDNASEDGMRIRRMVEEDSPTLAPYDQDIRATERDYAGEDPERVFTALRAFWNGLAFLLEGLTDDDWERPGTHAAFGPTTVERSASAEVRHSAEHLEQMRAMRAAISPA